MRTSAFALALGGSLVFSGVAALPARAQEAPAGGVPSSGVKVEHIDPTAPFLSRMGRAPDDVKRVSPGALLLASFDRNYDGKVSRAEISAAAPGVFAVVDTNKDGKITSFEQIDWAAGVGSQGEIIANPTMFDVNLDRSVTQEEFAKGLLRLADEVMGPSVQEIAFSDLMKPLSAPQPGDDGARPAVVARPLGGNQVSPTVVGN
jgi:hypothetical protein